MAEIISWEAKPPPKRDPEGSAVLRLSGEELRLLRNIVSGSAVSYRGVNVTGPLFKSLEDAAHKVGHGLKQDDLMQGFEGLVTKQTFYTE